MAKSDPQSKRKRTWGEFLFGDEGSAVKRAEYKREMGIDPANKRLQNVEVSASAKAMDNPTSAPNRTEASGGKGAGKKPATVSGGKEDKPIGLRGTAGTYTKSYDVKPAAPVVPPKKKAAPKAAPKMKPSTGAVKKDTPKSGRMSAFERQKLRSLEKEGWGGRSLSTGKAKARVLEERGYGTPKMPSFKKDAPKPVRKTSVKQGGSNSFAAKMQGRNDPRSPTYSPGTKSKSFKFKDLFKK